MLRADAGTEVRVHTAPGEFRFQPEALTPGTPLFCLNGAAAVERMPAEFPLTWPTTEDDFPAAAAGPAGTVWVAYVAYRYGQPEVAGACARCTRSAAGRSTPSAQRATATRCGWDASHPRGDAADLADIAAVRSQGRMCAARRSRLTRKERLGRLVAEPRGKLGPLRAPLARRQSQPITRITTDPAPTSRPPSGPTAKGSSWLAWQGFRGGQSDIFLVSLARGAERWSDPRRVSDSPATTGTRIACWRRRRGSRCLGHL